MLAAVNLFQTNHDVVDRFPPIEWHDIYLQYALHSAWYAGDPNRLANLYQAMAGLIPQNPSLVAEFSPQFWGRRTAAERRTTLHVPVASDICLTSAQILFGEPPVVNCDNPDSQARLQDIVDANHWRALLSEAGEICAALGGVFLKVNWDRGLADYPLISIAHPDQAIALWRYGRLVTVTFWRIEDASGERVVRRLETHQPGVIITVVYEGTPERLGTLLERNELLTGIDNLLAVYVPNTRPNRRFRCHPVGADLGQSDLAGLEGLMDSLDEVYSSLVRDVRLAQARIIVPRDYLVTDKSSGDMRLRFDLDREVYVGLDAIQAPGTGVKDNITLSQFEIRADEHIKTATLLLRQIYEAAGYSPQTFGLDVEGRAESGYALSVRERKTLMRASLKANYWRTGLQELLRLVLDVDRVVFGYNHYNAAVNVEMQDSIKSDPIETARSVQMLAAAQAASKQTLVRMLHPDWTNEQIEAEVARIIGETKLELPEIG